MSTKNNKTSNKTSSVNKKILKKEEDFSSVTIERCPHDKEHPYVMNRRLTIRDQTVSPDCRLMIIHILANVDSWIISKENIANEFSAWWGRDKVDSLIEEAIDAGYMRKETKKVNGFISKTKLFISENCSFSKNVRQTDKPSRRTRHNKIYKEDISRENNTKESHTPEIQLEKPKLKKTKAATAPSSPIIIFLKYEWFNEKTGLYETIETGMTEDEYEIGKDKIGESNFHKVINKIQLFLDKPKNPYRYSNKNLLKKVLEIHKHGLIKEEDKKQKQKEQALREGIKHVEEISEVDKLEQYEKQEFEIAKKFRYDNPDLRKYIRVIEHKDSQHVVHRRIEIMHCSRNDRWDTIRTPEPKILEKLEKWAKDIRHYKS